MSQNSSTVSQSVISDSHRCVGKLLGSNSSTLLVNAGSIYICIMHLQASITYLPLSIPSQQTTSRFRLHSSLLFSQQVHVVVNHARDSCKCCPGVLSWQSHMWTTSINRNKWSISWHTWISGTSVQQMRVGDIHTDIPTIIPHVWAIVMINVGLAQARPNHLNNFCFFTQFLIFFGFFCFFCIEFIVISFLFLMLLVVLYFRSWCS